jgi:hypothetical protein
VSLLVREGRGDGEERLPEVEKRWPADRKSVNLWKERRYKREGGRERRGGVRAWSEGKGGPWCSPFLPEKADLDRRRRTRKQCRGLIEVEKMAQSRIASEVKEGGEAEEGAGGCRRRRGKNRRTARWRCFDPNLVCSSSASLLHTTGVL